MVLKNVEIFKRNKPTRIIVAMIVSILAVRYLKETDFTRALLLPYGALGGAITIFLPLMIYFWFVHSSMDTRFVRMSAWVIYGILFLFLWGSQDPANTTSNWIYVPALIFVLVNLIFDKSLHEYFRMGELEYSRKMGKNLRRIDIKKKMGDVGEAWKRGDIEKSEYTDAMKDLKERYKKL
jgi:hypothetical protein